MAAKATVVRSFNAYMLVFGEEKTLSPVFYTRSLDLYWLRIIGEPLIARNILVLDLPVATTLTSHNQ
jgi:hypothetical protein